VASASRILILADSQSQSDSVTILSFMACKSIASPDCIITTEIVSEASCQFLDITDSESDQNFWSSPSFMSGRAFCGSIFDRIVVFGFFNEHLVDLLHLMITRETGDKVKNFQSWLLGIPIPDSFVGKSYSQFFEFSVLFSAIPVALYRSVDQYSYTYTNPIGDTSLTDTDLALVLVPYALVKDSDETRFNNYKRGNTGYAEKYFKEKRKFISHQPLQKIQSPQDNIILDIDPLDVELNSLRKGDDGDIPYTRLDND